MRRSLLQRPIGIYPFYDTAPPSWTEPHASSSLSGNTFAQIFLNVAASNGFSR